MKIIKKNKKIIKIKDAEAAELVSKGWKYCPKSEWKKKVRDVTKSPAKKSKKQKNEKKS
jgi:hypothetical protein